jgi:hypothetical protein
MDLISVLVVGYPQNRAIGVIDHSQCRGLVEIFMEEIFFEFLSNCGKILV